MIDGFMVEWWDRPSGDLAPAARWELLPDAAQARAFALERAKPWQRLVRVSSHDGGVLVATSATDLTAVDAWEVNGPSLPEPVAGLVLPPRCDGETRLEVMSLCREALALALRARLLSRRQVGRLLVAIDRMFEENPLPVPEDACTR